MLREPSIAELLGKLFPFEFLKTVLVGAVPVLDEDILQPGDGEYNLPFIVVGVDFLEFEEIFAHVFPSKKHVDG